MDISKVKMMLGINNSKHDEYLNEVIPLFIAQAEALCNTTFNRDALPSGVTLYVAKAIEFNMKPVTLKSRSMDSVSYSYNTELPRSVSQYLAPHRKLRAR